MLPHPQQYAKLEDWAAAIVQALEENEPSADVPTEADKLSSGQLSAVIDIDTGFLRVVIGGNRLVVGKGFGTTGQFVAWFGPDMAEELMDEAAGIFYLKTDGSTYYG